MKRDSQEFRDEQFEQANKITLREMRNSLDRMAQKIAALQTQIPEEGYESFAPIGENNDLATPWKMDWDMRENHLELIRDFEHIMDYFLEFNGAYLFDTAGYISDAMEDLEEKRAENWGACAEELQETMDEILRGS